MTTRAQILEVARSFLGAPFRHQGRSMWGLDCAGLVIRVAHRLGLSEFDTLDYARLPDGASMQALCNEHLVRIHDPRVGCVALMSIDVHPQHLGILTGEGIIHAHMLARRCVETTFGPPWSDHVVALYDYPGVID